MAPAVFEVTDISRIKPDADIAAHEAAIAKAVAVCPVRAIIFEEEAQGG